MKQFCVDYIGIITILAESEEEVPAKFKKEMEGVGDWKEIQQIDYVCDVEKLTLRDKLKTFRQKAERWIRLIHQAARRGG